MPFLEGLPFYGRFMPRPVFPSSYGNADGGGGVKDVLNTLSRYGSSVATPMKPIQTFAKVYQIKNILPTRWTSQYHGPVLVVPLVSPSVLNFGFQAACLRALGR
jgi:hypothetical protein